MKIKTSELIGAKLDWAVAKAVDVEIRIDRPKGSPHPVAYCVFFGKDGGLCSPSTDWRQGGSLIERLKVAIVYHNGSDKTPMASTPESAPSFQSGDTVLVAAMRAIVAAKLGEEIEVPEELV